MIVWNPNIFLKFDVINSVEPKYILKFDVIKILKIIFWKYK